MSEAEADLQRALEAADSQINGLDGLVAATELARLWQSQGRCDDTDTLLRPRYEWFSEGLDTKPLMNAKALLDELNGA